MAVSDRVKIARPRWTDTDITTLRTLYGTHTAREIATTLGRTVQAVRQRCHDLHLQPMVRSSVARVVVHRCV